MRGEGDYTWSTFLEQYFDKRSDQSSGLVRRDGKNLLKNPMAFLIHDMETYLSLHGIWYRWKSILK